MTTAVTMDRSQDDRLRLKGLALALPKAELHVHIEGTLEPKMLLQMAARHSMSMPWKDAESLQAAYEFDGLQSFLDLYYAGASVLRDEADFEALAHAYLGRAARDGVVHAELFFDPQTHLPRGVSLQRQVAGLRRGMARAQAESGITSALILCVLRHLSEEEGFAVIEEALPLRGQILGIGLDSSELGHPPEKFERLFRRVRELGWRTVAHAGEEGPPSYIRAAVELLGVDRIDHGVRCLEDPSVVKLLVDRRIPLTVCPLSNLKLKVVSDMADHNLVRLLDAGLVATVNSDDPAYFGGYMAENFAACIDALPMSASHVIALARNSIDASFLDRSQKLRHIDALSRIVDGMS